MGCKLIKKKNSAFEGPVLEVPELPALRPRNLCRGEPRTARSSGSMALSDTVSIRRRDVRNKKENRSTSDVSLGPGIHSSQDVVERSPRDGDPGSRDLVGGPGDRRDGRGFGPPSPGSLGASSLWFHRHLTLRDYPAV